MINDIKLGFKLMKHGLQFKTTVLCVVLFVLGGIMAGIADDEFSLSGFAFVMAAIMGYQLVQSVTCSTMVQSSPQKKKLQTTVSTICTWVCMMIFNTILVVVNVISMHTNHIAESIVAGGLVLDATFVLTIIVYMVVAMKMFWFAVIVMAGGFGGGYGVLLSVMSRTDFVIEAPISLGGAIAISYLAVFVGCGLMYLISLALYKKDFSKSTFESALKRAK